MAKSITSALVGILVRDGELEVDAPAPVAAWEGDPRGDITVEHLLHMSSGLEWKEGADQPESDLVQAVTSGDAAAYASAKDLAHEPGTEFLYSGGDTIILDRILGDTVGVDTNFRLFMDAELFDKLGMDPVELEFDGAGTWLGAYAADMTARDFAKFGLLYLRDGVWEGERILPEGWVDYTRRPSPANPIYGAHWWLDPERPAVLYAVGVDGQVITVDPEHDLTFVHLSTDGAEQDALRVSEAILDAFAEAPAASESSLTAS
jgi:CubicO group peptidase (beta-lactamase class C family)